MRARDAFFHVHCFSCVVVIGLWHSAQRRCLDYAEDEQPTHSRSKRMRTSFKHHQLRTMKQYFNLNHNPDAKDLKQLAQKTGLTKRVLQVWFQNARAKFRRSMHGNEGASISPLTIVSSGMHDCQETFCSEYLGRSKYGYLYNSCLTNI
ncbi:unnamed protein product [Angiostrongylus costaricensis]|uniref:Homeobox domain-containing protein n=1 Tax=Angiostrongylus costaricensis TaxID=334426 RepID=A0A0R3PRR1_ANGCS|nr:unnamed protein product [Angiostrongylus costaricensis]